MKTWQKRDEWISYAACGNDARFTSESSTQDSLLENICAGCRVRPECIRWAVDNKVSAVYVAGVRLPDPAFKRALRLDLERLGSTYEQEMVDRGDF